MAQPTGRTKSSITPPDKGAFPIDHYKECEDIVGKYMKCLNKHELMPKRCQELQIDDLMKPETMENLGFTKENLWETEEQRKRELVEKFLKINDDARKTVEERFKEMYKNDNPK